MRIAIKQPYIFPHLGYFQVIHAVDRFAVYDDVQYVARRWINRNRVLVNGEPAWITIPLEKASRNKTINELHLVAGDRWRKKLLRTLERSYSRAPLYPSVYPWIGELIHSNEYNLARFVLNTLVRVCDYLDIETEFIPSSTIYENSQLNRQHRILDICSREQASTYIDSVGGRGLYKKGEFERHGVLLQFLKTDPVLYTQFKNTFQPGLSIIDVLMFNSKDRVREYLDRYTLI